MKISNYLFILLNCLFSLAALPAKAAIATHQTGHQTQQLTIKKEKKSFFSKMKPATTDNGDKEGFYAILSLVGASVCTYYILTATGPGAIVVHVFLGMIGAACLLSGMLYLGIFAYKRRRRAKKQRVETEKALNKLPNH